MATVSQCCLMELPVAFGKLPSTSSPSARKFLAEVLAFSHHSGSLSDSSERDLTAEMDDWLDINDPRCWQHMLLDMFPDLRSGYVPWPPLGICIGHIIEKEATVNLPLDIMILIAFTDDNESG